MQPFCEKAFYLLLWRAFLVALVAAVLMVTKTFELGAALRIGANMALLFSVALVIYAGWLSDERIVQTEPWRALGPRELPAGAAGRRWAHTFLHGLVLRFAKSASAVAIAFSASALVLD